MKNIGIFYGTTTGSTEEVAKRLGELMNVGADDIHNVAEAEVSDFEKYEFLILGSSSWGAGELQDDWIDFLPKVKDISLEGKTIAIFGCGDINMSDTFNGAIGELYNAFKDSGAKIVGEFDASDYSFDESPAFIDGKYVGLLLDEVNHSDLTEQRLKDWTEILKKEL